MRGPRRIVCLNEETTETLYRLGEADRIVGISSFTVRPPEARREKPMVSQFIKADTEEILALRPDLVLAFSDLQADIAAALARQGLEVHVYNQRSVAQILEMIRGLARLVDAADRGEALARELEGNLERAREQAAAWSRRPRVYFEEWPDPIITGIRWVSELIEIAGGIDCFADHREASLAKDRIVGPEVVIARRPDLYLASWCGKKFRRKEALSRPGFEGAAFTAAGCVHEIDSAIILQPGPAALSDGIERLAGIFRAAVEQRSDREP